MKWFRRKSAPPADGTLANGISKYSHLFTLPEENHGSDGALKEARADIKRDQTSAAFVKLNRLKAERVRVEGVDFLRAHCFLRQGQPHAAVEALKEELRYFPNSAVAGPLLEKVRAELPAAGPAGEGEFEQLLEVVRPYTMVGTARLQSLYNLAKAICEEDLPGNFVECGVAAGGSSALLAAVIARHSKRPRTLFSFDTFEGMPASTEQDTHSGTDAMSMGWGQGTCAAPEDSLREALQKLDVEKIVQPVKGLFSDTLPRWKGPIGPVAFLHMDGDWYSSTRDILVNLFDSVVEGGRIQIDDYGFWEGCKKAVTDFFAERGLNFDLHPIDETGVWTIKRKQPRAMGTMVNLGCGNHFHSAWKNVDVAASRPGVIAHDLRKPLPFADGSCNVVYHSHVLEHFPKALAPAFLRECFRILKPGGILRVVVPNLEEIARLYLANLEAATRGEPEAAARYEWMTLELMDQMVREHSGGEMLRYWMRNPMPAEDFVVARMGREVLGFLEQFRKGPAPKIPDTPVFPKAEEVGKFRDSGEPHKWMYDRFSLQGLLEASGFVGAKVCAANESSILDFDAYHLDTLENGETRKPDSLFMEARKPTGSA